MCSRTLFFALTVCLGIPCIAHAADMPLKAPVLPAVSYNWSGFYLGGHVGYGWSRVDQLNITGNAAFPPGFEDVSHQNGWLGGAQLGYNFLLGPNWLAGFEGDFSDSGVRGDKQLLSTIQPRLTDSHDKLDWFATATGRLGFVSANWLFYVKGGAAWTEKEDNAPTVVSNTGQLTAITSEDDKRFGWTAGTGVEWGFAQHWSARLEYDYLDFGHKTETHNATYFNGFTGLAQLLRNAQLTAGMVNFAINYHLN
jgi:outer membrane autotransporter protein